MQTRLKIGEMAKLNNISVQALRYYEKLGVIEPKKVDKKSGYRYYTIDQSAQIDVIQTLQLLNFSLKEIKALLDNEDDSFDLVEKLGEKEEELLQLQKDIPYRLAMIRNLRKTTERIEDYDEDAPITFAHIPERHYYSYFLESNAYVMDMDTYEYTLRKFKSVVVEKNIPIVFHGSGSIMPKESFDSSEFVSKELYVWLLTEEQKKFATGSFPEGEYAVMYADSFQKEVDCLEIFRNNLEVMGYETVGNYICEVIYELPDEEDGRNMFIRMQVQVEQVGV